MSNKTMTGHASWTAMKYSKGENNLPVCMDHVSNNWEDNSIAEPLDNLSKYTDE